MILATEHNLHDVVAHALSEKALGNAFILVALEPRIKVARYVNLWEDTIGEVVGRQYYDDNAHEGNPDMCASRTVKCLTVRVRITDVMEALRRQNARADRDLAAPLRANRIRPRATVSTTR